MLQLKQKLIKVQYRPSIFDSAGFFLNSARISSPEVFSKWSRPRPVSPRPRPGLPRSGLEVVTTKTKTEAKNSVPRPRLPKSALKVVETSVPKTKTGTAQKWSRSGQDQGQGPRWTTTLDTTWLTNACYSNN